jgi:peptidoglycan/xylan/chitin deacetylase (PgdA/CDA1 family)
VTAVPILLYHSVAPSASPDYRPWCVDPADFGAHLDVVLDLGYSPMTVSAFLDSRADGSLPSKPCVITFDDGRADFVEHAVHELAARGIPSTMYVVSGHIGGRSSWLPMSAERSQPMMDWSDLASLASVGVEIGAHSETHRELDVLTPARLREEVSTSLDRLTEGLGIGVRSFAYPHGYHSRRVVAAVRDAGFDSAAAVGDRWSHVADDRFALSRMFVWNTTTPDDLADILSSPPASPERDGVRRHVLRTGWRCVRWARRHRPDTFTSTESAEVMS